MATRKKTVSVEAQMKAFEGKRAAIRAGNEGKREKIVKLRALANDTDTCLAVMNAIDMEVYALQPRTNGVLNYFEYSNMMLGN